MGGASSDHVMLKSRRPRLARYAKDDEDNRLNLTLNGTR